jgi:hypothetical protein
MTKPIHFGEPGQISYSANRIVGLGEVGDIFERFLIMSGSSIRRTNF